MPPARRLSPVFDALGCWALGKEFQLGARFGQSLSAAWVYDFEVGGLENILNG